MANTAFQEFKSEVKQITGTIAGSLLVLWSVWLATIVLFPLHLMSYGIHPRSMSGLSGIFFAPFLHASFLHIFFNSISFVLFGALILMQDIRAFWKVTVISALTSGLGTWLFGMPNTVHIGASGVIFGYFGYCVSIGFFKRKLTTIIFSLLFILMYGSMIFQVLPMQIGISWEGHLFGLMGGILSAFLLARESSGKQPA